MLNNINYTFKGFISPFTNLKKNGLNRFIKNIFSYKTPYLYNLIGLVIAIILIINYKINAKKRQLERERELIEYEKKINILKKIRLERNLRAEELAEENEENLNSLNDSNKNIYIPKDDDINIEESVETIANDKNNKIKKKILGIIDNLKKKINSKQNLVSNEME